MTTSAGQAASPASQTALIGRDAALHRLEHLLRSERRLVTVLGGPGIGKTRVALELARRASARSTSRVRFCDASAAATTDELAVSLQTALDGSGSAPQLPAAGELLLIVDAAEHATELVAESLARGLARAPQLRCLVTSRERLRIGEEVAYELEPLAEEHAVQLFVERASEARDGFALATEARATVAKIARLLDGVPLAIELAAAQMVVLSPAALLARLDQRLLLFVDGRRDAPARHASLRASIEWSWNGLAPAERSVLAQCSVFRGGFSLSAAEAIVENTLSPEPLVNLLRRLCDRSLVRGRTASSAESFELLSSVAVFAREQLAARDDASQSYERHASYYLALAARAPLHTLRRTGCPATLQDNLLAIAEWGVRPDATARDGLEHALRALAWLADVCANLEDLAEALDAAIEQTTTRQASAHAFERAKLARARLRVQQAAATALPELMRLAETSSDAALRADAWFALGQAERRAGQSAAAEHAYGRALAIAIELGDRHAEARIVTSLACLAYERRELVAARVLHDRALAVYRALDDHAGAAVVLQNTGLILQEQGQLSEAEAIFNEAAALHRQFGHVRFEAIAHFDLAGLAFERGLPEGALAHAVSAEAQLREVHELRLAALALALRASCEAALGDLDAARLHLDQSSAELARFDDRVFAEVVAVQRGHLELGLARRAYGFGQDAHWAEHLSRARGIVDRAVARDGAALGSWSSECDELRLAERVLRGAFERHTRLADALCVASDRAWLRGPHATRVELGAKKTLCRLLGALIQRRLSARDSPLNTAELIRVGWPDQRVTGSAATNRLQVALSQLRRAGLERVLVRQEGGYVLDPEIDVWLIS